MWWERKDQTKNKGGIFQGKKPKKLHHRHLYPAGTLCYPEGGINLRGKEGMGRGRKGRPSKEKEKEERGRDPRPLLPVPLLSVTDEGGGGGKGTSKKRRELKKKLSIWLILDCFQ